MDECQRQRLMKAIKEFTDRATKSPKIARQTLIDEGIYTEDGQLSPNYKPKPD